MEDGLVLGTDDGFLDGNALGTDDGVLLGIVLGVNDGNALGLLLGTDDGIEMRDKYDLLLWDQDDLSIQEAELEMWNEYESRIHDE